MATYFRSMTWVSAWGSGNSGRVPPVAGSDDVPDDDSSTSRPRVTVEREPEANEERPNNAEGEGAEDDQIQALEAEVESVIERVDNSRDEITELVVAGERDEAEQTRANANQELERLLGKTRDRTRTSAVVSSSVATGEANRRTRVTRRGHSSGPRTISRRIL